MIIIFMFTYSRFSFFLFISLILYFIKYYYQKNINYQFKANDKIYFNDDDYDWIINKLYQLFLNFNLFMPILYFILPNYHFMINTN